MILPRESRTHKDAHMLVCVCFLCDEHMHACIRTHATPRTHAWHRGRARVSERCAQHVNLAPGTGCWLFVPELCTPGAAAAAGRSCRQPALICKARPPFELAPGVSDGVCVCVCVCARACVCVYVCVMFHHHHHHHTHSTLLAIPPQALRPARQVPVPPRTRGQQQCRRQGLRWTSPPQGYTKEAWRLQRLCLGKASGCHLCRGGHQAQEGILVPIHPRVPPPQCGTPQGRRR